ncbi:DUF6286 domain-containing protein [Arenivirga flava]|uniref:DUF6286 domain-containing protein n=1 Tax=Arenivirga flava TaxID=1930060 RepID=A0AA37XCA4_9MICO|nr:DUF6286 domain-containing protein [Arenivirga flava]GMA29533.1 hypothetical protein GCM10025874_27860 [Arenivirga flava]
MNARTRRRLGNRMRHRSRSVAVSIGLWVAALPLAYLAVEAVLELVGAPALWQRPLDVVGTITGAEAVRYAVAGAAILAAVILLVLAFAPGRLSRHELADERMLVIVDDEVLAGALSRATATVAGVPRDRVSTSVGSRSAEVTVRPTSGFGIDRDEVAAAAERELERLAPSPRVRQKVRIETAGVIGR